MANNVVGTAYVRLRLLTDSIGKDIEKSIQKGDLQNVDIKVKADTAEADAKLAATAAEADALGSKDPVIKPKVDSKNAEHSLGLLSTAIVGLIPTIGPLAAAATAGFAGIAAGAGVAVLAIHGIKNEMKDGTALGEVYAAGITTLKTDFDKLGATAAKGLLGGFATTIHDIQAAMPGVNESVARLSVLFGDLAGHVVVGLIAGLKTFEPLLQHVAALADQAAIKFQAWATGPGGAAFGDKLSAAFDQVVPILANLAQVIGRIVAAAAPLGSTILSGFGLLSKLVLALPIPVLQTLILGIVALKTALTGLAIIEKINTGFEKFGTAATKAGLPTTAARFGALGAAGLIAGAALFGLSTIMDENAKHAQYVAKTTQDYVQALTDTHGAVTAAVSDLTLQNAVTDGTAQTLQKAGISVNEWVAAIQNGGPALTDLSNKLLHSTGPAHLLYSTLIDDRDAFVAAQKEVKTYTDATDAANRALAASNPQLAAHAAALGLTATAYQNAESALDKKITTDQKNFALQQLEIAQNYQLAGTQDYLSKAYGITTAQVQQYAAMLGITQKQVQDGQVGWQRYSDAVRTIETAYEGATATGSAFLASLQTFSQSAGTAADRAQLLGAYLKAAQGDMLSFDAAMASATTANKNLITSFDAAQKKAINLKTGFIDVTQAGAGPLIQSLQGMQDSAMAAAQAMYQHEVSTLGAGQAAKDAAAIFKDDTYNALVDDAKQLGITSGEAKKLADRYFALPTDVETRVKAIGTDPVVSVLEKIGRQLAYLTGQPWDAKVGVQDNATSVIDQLQAKLRALNGSSASVAIYQQLITTQQVAAGRRGRAGGGPAPEGWFTVGEGNPNTWELGHKQGSSVQFFSNAQSKKMMPGGPYGPMPGFQAGGSIGTTSTGGKSYYTFNGQQYSSLVAAENAQASVARQANKQAITLRFTIDNKDLAGLRKSLGGTAAQIAAQLSKLTTDLTKAAGMIPGRQGQYGLLLQIEGDNNRLNALVKRRDQLTSQLQAANTRLAGLQRASAQETQTVAQAVYGGFNITSAGQFQVGGATYSNAAAILANLRGNVAQAKTFASQLATLRRRGLSKMLLQQLAEAGYTGAGANVAALSKASGQQLRAINNEYTTLIGAGMRAGQTVSNALYGQQIAQAQAVVKEISKSRNATVSAINALERRIEQLARALANRAVVLQANGRELARVVNNQNAANGRR